MITSAFEGLLAIERIRRRAARDGGFALPVMQELQVGLDEHPFLVSNSASEFLQPVVSSEGVLRYGFSPCTVEDESKMLLTLWKTIWQLSETNGWSNRCTSLTEALAKMSGFGLEPKTLLVPLLTLSQMCGQEITLEDAQKITVGQGFVTKVDDMKVLFSGLPEDLILVGTTPALVGTYTRVDDYLGLVLRQVNRSVMLVQNELAR